jgi:hypothetical protein
MSESSQKPKPKPEPVWVSVGPTGAPTVTVVGTSGKEGTVQELDAGQTIGDDFFALKKFKDPKTELPPPDSNAPPNSPNGLMDYYLVEARKAIAANDMMKAKNMILGVRSMISMVKVMAEKNKNPALASQMEPYEKKIAEFDAFFKTGGTL